MISKGNFEVMMGTNLQALIEPRPPRKFNGLIPVQVRMFIQLRTDCTFFLDASTVVLLAIAIALQLIF